MYKKLLLLIAVVAICFAYTNTAIAQTNIYEVEPDINNCIPGKLSQVEKDNVIKLINDIRKHHKLGPVTWNADKEDYAQAAALNIAASNVPGHAPTPGTKCHSDASDIGRLESNLHTGWGTAGYIDVTYDEAIIGWLIDNHNYISLNPNVVSPNVGHRRLVINPFLASTALGLINKAPHPTNSGQDIGTSTLWGITWNAMSESTTCENDFVAYPYENYPPAWVDKEMYLSFHPIPDPNNCKTEGATDFTNASIVVKDENGTTMQVHSIAPDDGQAWGAMFHSLAFKVAGLEDSVKYEVTISNVIVNNSTRTYNYWFKLTDEAPNPLADVPTLVSPANGSIDMETPFELSWNESENAVEYKLEVSRSSSFTYKDVDMTLPETNYSFLDGLIPNNTYYWRVAAINIDEVVSDYSEVWTFNSKVVIPEPPNTIYPTANNQDIARRDEYKWNSIDEAVHYNLQIATAEDFSPSSIVINQQEIIDTLYYLNDNQMLDEFTDYWWRVNAYLLSDNETDWSEPISYKTNDNISSIVEFPNGIVVNCYPNPFTTNATINVNTHIPTNVSIEIFNLLGERIATLFNGTISESKTMHWTPPFNNSAVYYCKIKVGNTFKIITLNKN